VVRDSVGPVDMELGLLLIQMYRLVGALSRSAYG
jgi:hypothetical protein